MALAFLGAAALLTAAEAAFSFLPRHDAEQAVQGSQGPALRRILEQPMTHMRALRFWRIWFETASAVAVAVLLYSLLDNVWLAGLAATGIMAVLGFVLVGVSPRQLGRSHPAAVAQYSASLVRFLAWVLGPIPAWLVRLGSAAAPGSPNGDDSYFSEEEFRELVDRATESDMIEDNEAELIQSVFEFGDTLVRAVMVPRTDILTIDAGSSLHSAMSLFLRSGYSRASSTSRTWPPRFTAWTLKPNLRSWTRWPARSATSPIRSRSATSYGNCRRNPPTWPSSSTNTAERPGW